MSFSSRRQSNWPRATLLTAISSRKFIYTKHYFWFSEEPSTAESLIIFLRSEKADAKHSSAAWARETGKGLLFFSKRAEDKATPAGVINLVSQLQPPD